MTDTPEMTEWLNRIIFGTVIASGNVGQTPGHGEKQTLQAFGKGIGEARALLFSDLKYDITRKQFEGLKDAIREEYPVKEERVKYRVLEKDKSTGKMKPTGRVHYRLIFRDILGRFTRRK